MWLALLRVAAAFQDLQERTGSCAVKTCYLDGAPCPGLAAACRVCVALSRICAHLARGQLEARLGAAAGRTLVCRLRRDADCACFVGVATGTLYVRGPTGNYDQTREQRIRIRSHASDYSVHRHNRQRTQTTHNTAYNKCACKSFN